MYYRLLENAQGYRKLSGKVLGNRGAGPQVVKAEIDRFIELLFRDYDAYRLALKLYAGRYEVIARLGERLASEGSQSA